MGFLALVALASAGGSLVFEVSAETDRWLTLLEGVIILIFVVEFIVQFAVADDRKAWLRSPWRIVDAACIIGPLLSLLPWVPDNLRGALVFRLLRVGRAVAFGARAGAVAVQRRRGDGRVVRRGDVTVTAVSADEAGPARATTWQDLLDGVRDQRPVWYHAENVSGARFREIAPHARTASVDQAHFEASDGRSHAASDSRATSLYLSLPTVAEIGFPEVSRNRLLLHVSAVGVLSATAFPSDLQTTLTGFNAGVEATPLPVRTTYGVLATLRDRYRHITRRYKDEVVELEELLANERGALFLRDAFRLQREIASASADLWRFKGIVGKLANGSVPLPGTNARKDPYFDELLGEILEIEQDFGGLKEELKSLMELHMNITSFEMNKFMKLLAIVGFLGLIPSVAGGLLGMNVLGNPWSVTLGQVAFGITTGMAVALYIFGIKGWLR